MGRIELGISAGIELATQPQVTNSNVEQQIFND